MNFSTLARNSISGRLSSGASRVTLNSVLFILSGYLWVPLVFGYFKIDEMGRIDRD
jgi:hypothetical protein